MLRTLGNDTKFWLRGHPQQGRFDMIATGMFALRTCCVDVPAARTLRLNSNWRVRFANLLCGCPHSKDGSHSSSVSFVIWRRRITRTMYARNVDAKASAYCPNPTETPIAAVIQIPEAVVIPCTRPRD